MNSSEYPQRDSGDEQPEDGTYRWTFKITDSTAGQAAFDALFQNLYGSPHQSVTTKKRSRPGGAEPTPKRRPTLQELGSEMDKLAEAIANLEDERDEALCYADNIYRAKRIRRHYDEQLDIKRMILRDLETRYAHQRDELNEDYETAAQRDGTAMYLLSLLEDKEN